MQVWLKEIDSKQRILLNMQRIWGGVDKYFDPCEKYAKNEGKGFCHHTKHYHDGALIVPIYHMTGTCNVAIWEGACVVYH